MITAVRQLYGCTYRVQDMHYGLDSMKCCSGLSYNPNDNFKTDPLFTNTTLFHSQTAGTSENANNYGDHLQQCPLYCVITDIGSHWLPKHLTL